jgi:hypothetical protein
MKDVLDAVLSWKALVGSLLIFGFMPGAALRLIVLAFPKGDPRRAESRGELLHRVPRWERPLWVVEQLECALFEGLAPRVFRRMLRGVGWLRTPATSIYSALRDWMEVEPTWDELFPDGRIVFYEGDDPDRFAFEMRLRGIDVRKPPANLVDRVHWDEGRSFYIPPGRMEEIYGSGRWSIGS